jgi:predicted ATPase
MYLKTLTLRNFKSFASEVVPFRSSTEFDGDPALFPNVTLLLGDNGSGKSSILRAAALALVGDTLASSGFVPHNLVRRGGRAKVASVRADAVLHWHDLGEKTPSPDVEAAELEVRVERFTLREELQITREKRLERVYAATRNSEHARLVFGYSATRRVEQPENYDRAARKVARVPHYARIASLFEEQFTLIPLAAWLPRFEVENPGRAKQVRTLMNRLMPDDCAFTGRLEGGDYLFTHRQTTLPFSSLSDGYRAYIGWIADLLYHLATSCPTGVKLVESRAIALVDEIDLHLHPSWQMVVLPRLARALSNVQFVVTTHSPIVAGSLEAWNVIRIERAGGEPSRVNRSQVPLHGLSSEQILLSPYFGLESTRAPDARHSLQLRALKAAQGDDDAVRDFMMQLAGTAPTLATTNAPRAAEATPVARPTAAKKSAKKGAKKSAKKSAKKTVKKSAKKTVKKSAKTSAPRTRSSR